SSPACIASIACWSGRAAPHSSPLPASQAPKPIKDSSGPLDPRVRRRIGPNVPGPAFRLSLGAIPSEESRERSLNVRALNARSADEEAPDGIRPGSMVVKTVEEKERVVIRFAGDSGDGMQLTGDRFTNATAILGNDLATLPDFPAEIRAPAGTVGGVSAFQIHFAARDLLARGDTPNVLVAMNPAALKPTLALLQRGATIIV